MIISFQGSVFLFVDCVTGNCASRKEGGIIRWKLSTCESNQQQQVTAGRIREKTQFKVV
jgi:hypothetical protein